MTDDKWVLVTPEGKVTAEAFNPDDTLHEFYRLLGCDTVDVVRLDHESGLDMWVDDNGMVTGEPVNVLATHIARQFGFIYQPYVGRALFAQSNDEGETIGLSTEWFDRFMSLANGGEDEEGTECPECHRIVDHKMDCSRRPG